VQVLVTGATGYIGGRLVPELLARGHQVRCGVRTPAKLADRPWREQVEVVKLDVSRPSDLDAAVEGMEVVYHLVHSMDGEDDFAERDRQAAANVRDACQAAGVARIVYLGGLGNPEDDLSEHLRSRHETGRELAAGTVPVTELRAAIIIGSGSASFEMLRNLVEVLPVMVTPRWVDTRCQPIAVRDVLRHLVDVIELEETAGRVLEIGGPDVLTYRELMHAYAEVAGLRRRLIVPVPVLTPRLSSLWVGLVTPLPAGLARPLVGSLVNEVVVTDDTAERLLPGPRLSFRESVRLALQRIQDLEVVTTWAGAQWRPTNRGRPDVQGQGPAGRSAAARGTQQEGESARPGVEQPSEEMPEDPHPEDPDWSGGTVLTDERIVDAEVSPAQLWRSVCSLGGERGYHTPRLLWSVRGLIDEFVGGVGVRRGRRHPDHLAVGDALDFWRVERVQEGELLRLRAEMRLPGEAWLDLRVEPTATGSRLIQRARFHPRGLSGRAYWAVLVPFHRVLFPRMARGIVRAAVERTGDSSRRSD
jgi:uncharacterized protein YbjT (DUF2867 family)